MGTAPPQLLPQRSFLSGMVSPGEGGPEFLTRQRASPFRVHGPSYLLRLRTLCVKGTTCGAQQQALLEAGAGKVGLGEAGGMGSW